MAEYSIKPYELYDTIHKISSEKFNKNKELYYKLVETEFMKSLFENYESVLDYFKKNIEEFIEEYVKRSKEIPEKLELSISGAFRKIYLSTEPPLSEEADGYVIEILPGGYLKKSILDNIKDLYITKSIEEFLSLHSTLRPIEPNLILDTLRPDIVPGVLFDKREIIEKNEEVRKAVKEVAPKLAEYFKEILDNLDLQCDISDIDVERLSIEVRYTCKTDDKKVKLILYYSF